ncbi:hypothetical protein [Vogesella indigofera]|uniref:hypothetical protein n=1 Tax=Vogesella indigofera TaxID=45465 RepID=UPI0011C44A7B|nr:hypothetical protein [Vogesella indigofera]
MRNYFDVVVIWMVMILVFAFFCTACASDYETIKIPKNKYGVFYINHCPTRFFSGAPLIEFKFYSSAGDLEKIMNELGRDSAKGRVVFESFETNQRQVYGKSSMYGGYVAKDSVRVSMDFIKSASCQKYKVIVEEAFNEDVDIYVGNRYL